ncbi:hypothetical protein [Vulcanisaeta sp. JCM 16159]|uniref:hypothetical protein n=1 Tax=Vulcanisaeta sp. JCM 16159 TaxID=1295371 RepID=UPI000ACF0122|nr:hypothetical protein [Vulcanisaeta sp. JCM 16159]
MSNGVSYNVSYSIISLLNAYGTGARRIVGFVISMFNNAYYFGVPGDLRSVYVHGNVGYRRVYGYVMYIRRFRSVSIHIGVSRIRREFGDCAAYWGWQVLAHEIAHLVGVGGGITLGMAVFTLAWLRNYYWRPCLWKLPYHLPITC